MKIKMLIIKKIIIEITLVIIKYEIQYIKIHHQSSTKKRVIVYNEIRGINLRDIPNNKYKSIIINKPKRSNANGHKNKNFCL